MEPAERLRPQPERRYSEDEHPPLERMLVAMRGIALLAMLLVTLVWPMPNWTGYTLWPLVVVLGAYYLIVEVVRRSVPRLRSFAWVSFVDLPVASLLYYLNAEPGGPLFVSFYVAVVTAAASLRLRPALLYTGGVVGIILFIAPALPLWSGAVEQVRTMSVRLIVLAFVGIGTAALAQRLAREEVAARTVRGEAERLAELDRLRREFISTVSHDLRTPLTAARAALGMVATSADQRLTLDERQLVDNAWRNIGRLGLLIDDLLAFNQLEVGTLQLDCEPLDMRRVVSNAVDALQPLFRDKQQSLEILLPQPLPVRADAKRLEQAVTNLLANAHLHTPSGTRVTVSGQNGTKGVQLRISDNGPGIPMEQLEEVFRRFYRTAPTGGSGLGLAIARRLVELHGGSLCAESLPREGVTFSLTLPSHHPPHPPVPPTTH
jgi:signal transduction histidine kinase